MEICCLIKIVPTKRTMGNFIRIKSSKSMLDKGEISIKLEKISH
jgi:hypothetical protein